jgi:hypothetical protein
MTKKEFIWLLIRFTGLAWLIFSAGRIATALKGMLLGLSMLPLESFSEAFISLTLFNLACSSAMPVIIALYLLLFGKYVFSLIHRTSGSELDMPLQRAEIAEVLIRFVGLLWLWRLLKYLLNIAGYFLNLILMKYPFTVDTSDDDLMERFRQLLVEKIDDLTFLGLANVLIYVGLTWYFFKRGQFFINWLHRSWSKVAPEEQNIDHAESV